LTCLLSAASPGITAAQLSLIETSCDPRCARGLTNALNSRGILGGVTQKYGHGRVPAYRDSPSILAIVIEYGQDQALRSQFFVTGCGDRPLCAL